MKRLITIILTAAVIVSCRSNAEKILGTLPDSCDPVKVSEKITLQLVSCEPESYAPKGYDGDSPVGKNTYWHYSTNSAYVNALQITMKTGNKELRDLLAARFFPYLAEKKSMQSRDNHVDHSIFGAIPLELYLDGYDNPELLPLGLHYADHQWAEPDSTYNYGSKDSPYYAQLMQYWNDGYSPQTRLWIDDMYMINVLQTQAYRATGDRKYIDRAAKEMVLYLNELQNPDGLFYHTTSVPYVWGRGDGWMAGGMPMILQYLSEDDPYYAPILEGYRKMMAALLANQREDGLWGQLVTDPDSWAESSCSAMFTFGFIEGIKHGWLDASVYAPAAKKAWIKLVSLLDEYGNIPDVCVGTGALDNHDYYLARPRVNGDPHGQAPMLWICNALL